MFDSRWVRLLTAMLAATWSPGHFCCCQAQAAEAVAVAWPAPPSAGASHGGCCAVAPEAQPRAPIEMSISGGCGNRCEEPVDANPCGCIDVPTDILPPTGDAVLAGAKHSWRTVDLLATVPVAVMAVAAGADRVRPCRGSPAEVPRQSLYAQHCLLTT